MPQNGKSVDEMVSDAKNTLANLKVIPSSAPKKTEVSPSYHNAPYSVAKEARDTGKSINYNLKQQKVANDATATETK